MKLPAFLTTLPVLVKNIYKKNTGAPCITACKAFLGLGNLCLVTQNVLVLTFMYQRN